MSENVRRTDAKSCSVCGKKKQDNGKNFYRDSVCGACYQRRYKTKHPDRVRNARLKCAYGISKSQYDLMAKNQEFKCVICKSDEKTLVVDHCHVSNNVRDLLCHMCNMRVGIVENWGTLIQEYLNKHQN